MFKETPYFLKLSRDEQKASVEALIFASEEPLNKKTLAHILLHTETNGLPHDISQSEFNDDENKSQITIYNEILNKFNITPHFFDELIEEINLDLQTSGRPFHIVHFAGGWQFATRNEYGRLVHQLIKSKSKRRLTQAALETLAIIAYRQPVTKSEVDQIRGVNSVDVINSLNEKNLVRIVGRRKTLGKPLLYGTTLDFLKTFGLNSLDDLPKLRELEDVLPSAATTDESENQITLSDFDDNEIEKLDIINVESDDA